MKKLYILLFSISLSIFISGCGNDSTFKKTKEKETDTKEVKTNKEQKINDEKKITKLNKKEDLKIKQTTKKEKPHKKTIEEDKPQENIKIKPKNDDLVVIETSDIDFKIVIDKKEEELVKAVYSLKNKYILENEKIINFYKEKKDELILNYEKNNKTINDDLLDIKESFENDCKVFTMENIDICNAQKNKIERLESMFENDKKVLSKILKEMERNEKKELATMKINFQKAVLETKNNYILSK